MNKRTKTGIFLLAASVLISGGVIANNFLLEANRSQERVGLLEQQVSMLQDQVVKLSGADSQFAASIQAINKNTPANANKDPGNSANSNKTQPLANSSVNSSNSEDVVTKAVANINPSVVSVRVSRKIQFRSGMLTQRVGAGSGFIVSPSGYILTNKHVVDYSNAIYTVVLPDGSEDNATLVKVDDNNDIAVLKIDRNNLDAVQLGDSSNLQLGQTAIAIGNALGEYSNTVSVGIISGLNRTIEAEDRYGDVQRISGTIQTDAAINPGNSGGPLIDKEGKVIGINVATILGSNSISFAIPIDAIKSDLNGLGI